MKREELKDYLKHYMQFHHNQMGSEEILYFIENVFMTLQPFKVTNMDCECVCKCDKHLVELDLGE